MILNSNVAAQNRISSLSHPFKHLRYKIEVALSYIWEVRNDGDPCLPVYASHCEICIIVLWSHLK